MELTEKEKHEIAQMVANILAGKKQEKDKSFLVNS